MMRIITAREQVEMLSPWRTASGFDPMKVTNRLKGEFHDWFDTLPDHRLQELKNIEMHPFMDHHENNPVSHWPTVERFLKDKYPAAHRGFMTGHEDASMWLDDPNNEYEDPMLEGDDEFGSLPPPEPYSSDDHQKLGYDPQEVAAGMVLLHNRAHSGRQDSYLNTDKKRLVDIFNKRQQMQRNYEQRQSSRRRTAMPSYYHYTHDPNFTPDPTTHPWDHFEKPPEDAWWEQPKRKTPGLYVSPDPNEWQRIDRMDGGRPHRVELEGPEADNEGEERGHFIPGDRLNQYTVKSVTPNQFWADQKAENERWDEQQKYYGRLAVSQEERIRQTYNPAHIHLPPEIAAHYMTHKERSDPRQKEDIARNGIQRPVEMVTDGTHGYLSEGYHRTQAAGELGIPVPTHVYRVKDTGGWGKPLEPHLKGWLDANPDAGFHMGGRS